VWESNDRDWLRVKVTAPECDRIPAEFLQEERRAVADRWFRQEYLCEFVDLEEVLFTQEMLERAVTHEVKPLVIE